MRLPVACCLVLISVSSQAQSAYKPDLQTSEVHDLMVNYEADLGYFPTRFRPEANPYRWLRGGQGMSPIFAACNRNKRGVAIDLQHPDGHWVNPVADEMQGNPVLVTSFTMSAIHAILQ